MKILLKNRGLLKISGKDAREFIQNQFSNDIEKLNHSSVQINAYCQHQGKIIGLFWVMRYEDNFLLSFPLDLADVIKSRLQIFIIMSDVIIDDISRLARDVQVHLKLREEIKKAGGILVSPGCTFGDDADAEAMESREREAMQSLGFQDPYQLELS